MAKCIEDSISFDYDFQPKFAIGKLEGWSGEFRYWEQLSGFEPVALVKSHTGPEDYTQNRAHVFKLKAGTFALVIDNLEGAPYWAQRHPVEAGCSYYDPGWAVVEFHPDLRAANKAFAAWFEENGKERTL